MGTPRGWEGERYGKHLENEAIRKARKTKKAVEKVMKPKKKIPIVVASEQKAKAKRRIAQQKLEARLHGFRMMNAAHEALGQLEGVACAGDLGESDRKIVKGAADVVRAVLRAMTEQLLDKAVR